MIIVCGFPFYDVQQLYGFLCLKFFFVFGFLQVIGSPEAAVGFQNGS